MNNLFQTKNLNTGRAHAGVSDYNRDICLSSSQPQPQLDQADAPLSSQTGPWNDFEDYQSGSQRVCMYFIEITMRN